MRTTRLSILLSLFAATAFSQNQIPQLSNLSASIDAGAKKYTLTFDVADAENDSLHLLLDLSSDGGQHFDLSSLPMTGDAGFPIFQKTGAKIEVDLSSLTGPLPTSLVGRLSVFDNKPVDYQAIADEVDSLRLKSDLNFVVGKRHRQTDPTHLQAVRDSLKNYFNGKCLAVRDQPFAYGAYTGHNIAGRHAGFSTPKKTVVVDGHYDTVAASPGADDNGSAVVGAIEAARVLTKYPTESTVQFSFFDLEEEGTKGSAAYNNNADGVEAGEQILGAFNFEMISYYSEKPNSQTTPTGFGLIFPGAYNQVQADSFRGNFITNISNDISTSIETAFTDAAAAHVPGLKVVTVHIAGNWQNAIYADLLRSDHVSFWLKNRPAIQLTDGANFRNPCYHLACDTAAKLNFTFMANVVRASAVAAAKMAGAKHGSWKALDCPLPQPSGTADLSGCAWLVFPNPTGREVFLKTDNCPAQRLEIEVVDVLGKTVRSAAFDAPFDGSERVSLDGLAAGPYFLKMNVGRAVRTERIVIH